jgi:hypothetical protein
VEATQKHLIDYETTNGKKPFREWLDDLDFSVRYFRKLWMVEKGNIAA